ncbi:MAG: ATP-binding protein [Acidobacteria bacterium]|nr:ATP-binding protein [Acidobacteriota bacterium]
MAMGVMERAVVGAILKRIEQPPELIQLVTGPRQVGKTTAARQVMAHWVGAGHYAAADLPLPPGPEWIEVQWDIARRRATAQTVLLVLDEVQKVRGWSEVVKALWDEDRARGRALEVLLLGSSALLLARGAADSLAGRYFLHRCSHWSWPECRSAFDWDLDTWLWFGGYPGAAPLVGDEDAWRAYIADSLVEAVIARDVLGMQTVAKPALLRNLFALSTRFPAQLRSYTKMLGQLHDAGNTTTLAHYLRLLETAYMVSGLERFSAGHARSRGSSPKLVVWNNALVTALSLRSFRDGREDPVFWGHLVENAVGAHLLNHLQGLPFEVTYWRERDLEVDFVVRAGNTLWAIEVKSGLPGKGRGIAAFREQHPKARALVVGPGGMPLDEFFEANPAQLLTPPRA